MKKYRMGSILAVSGLVLSFVLSVYLKDPTPFTVVAPVAIGGKWVEAYAERRYSPKPSTEE